MISIPDEQLLTVEQARSLLPGVGEATVWRWIASGKLESVKLGGRRFTSQEALQRMAQNGPQRPQAAPLPPTTRQRRRGEHLAHVNKQLDQLLGA